MPTDASAKSLGGTKRKRSENITRPSAKTLELEERVAILEQRFLQMFEIVNRLSTDVSNVAKKNIRLVRILEQHWAKITQHHEMIKLLTEPTPQPEHKVEDGRTLSLSEAENAHTSRGRGGDDPESVQRLDEGASFGNEQLDSASQGNEQLDRPSRGAVTATVEGKDCHAFGYQDGTVQLHEKGTLAVLSRFPPDETGENGHMGPILQICFLEGDKGDTIRSICSSRLIERNVSTGNVKRSEVAQRRRTPEEKKRAAPSDTAPSGAGTPPKKSKMADSRAAPPAVPAKSRRQQEREHRNQARVDYFLHTEATDEVKHYRNVMCKKETQMDWLRWRLLQYIHSNRTKVIDDVLNAWAKVYNYNEMGIPNHIEKLSRDKLETLKANLEDDYFLAVVKNGYDEDYYEKKKKSNGLPELCSTKYDNKMNEAREKDNKWFKALKFLEPHCSLYTKCPFDVFRDALLMAKDPPEGYVEAWEPSNPTRRQFSSDRFEHALKTLTDYEKDFEKRLLSYVQCSTRPLCKPRADYFASLDWHNAPENTAFRALAALYKVCPYQSDVLKAKVLKHITALDLKTVGKDDVEEYLLIQLETLAQMGDNTLPRTWRAMISLKKKIKDLYPALWPSNPNGLNEKGVPDWDILE